MVLSSENLRVAIPSDGAMYEPSLLFLDACGLKVNRINSRRYVADIPFLPGVDVLFQRSSDITSKVEDGTADLGLIGYDRYLEMRNEDGPSNVLMNTLGFGGCSLSLGIPDSWIDVSSIADLADIAVDFKNKGNSLRIATKSPRLVERFLLSNGISNFSIVESSGTLEVAPAMGFADIIADITSSGTTMRENHLKNCHRFDEINERVRIEENCISKVLLKTMTTLLKMKPLSPSMTRFVLRSKLHLFSINIKN